MATKLHLLYQITKYVFGRLHVTAPPVALNRYAIRLAGHQRSRQVSYAGMNPQGENLLKLLGGMGPQGDGKKYKFF